MTKQQLIDRIAELKAEAAKEKAMALYHQSEQEAIKLFLNGTYGTLANQFFLMYNPNVAAAVTAQGRELGQKMDEANTQYWYNEWHLDFELHEKLGITNVKKIPKNKPVSIYADTDSLFVSYDMVLTHCDWKHAYANELEFIFALDKHRIADHFKKHLSMVSERYGVTNIQDFEFEDISDIILVEKKKYIKHIFHQDGIGYDRLTYFLPKGVELVRSSTPEFARTRIYDIIRYLFSNPDTYNIRDLLRIIKELRADFDKTIETNVDAVCMQSSVTNYEKKVSDDTRTLMFQKGTHFAVKAAAYHNLLLKQNKEHMVNYKLLRSGDKVKYYYTLDTSENKIFAYERGNFPAEFAPEMDKDLQFAKSILSPINAIVRCLGMPMINKRLKVLNALMSDFIISDQTEDYEEEDMEFTDEDMAFLSEIDGFDEF